MNRKVFYPHGAKDVVSGFLSAGLSIAVVGYLVYMAFSGLATAGYWALKLLFSKFGALILVGISSMLYRERITMDAWEQSITIQRNWFVIPMGKTVYQFSQVNGIRWDHDSEARLRLDVANESITLARRPAEDPALSQELREYLGLCQSNP
ncbi:hypothetical protein JST97_26710 [bacterium]|nr:hypothetical protein [bacterium]